jgi:signal transduction histidine kinase
LRLHIALGAAHIQGDPQLLERLVANLIDNAIRHNAAGGGIDVTTATTAAAAVLSVANDGPVVPVEELERLRVPFQRLGTARTSPGDGHGLGLSIVHAIAVAHEAQLTIGARLDGGLVVEACFPPNM